ncbi:hypothetical protein PVAP13_6KG226106 [Panicum virgatum]|uniref:Reverse transcriptase domain-containing protein n=1 Tax=Panicum virgatum TaxID=38727 RepID=A0A8T0RB03_PANVG|nr:hypothetical protein PVAP13_6KG226106 [Panicum virgatum]
MPCILVMNVLNRVVFKAEAEGLLIPLHSTGQRLSLYADDVTLFIRSEKEDLHITKELLKIFCDASGLQTNIQKSWFIPIHCDGEIVEVVNTTLQCTTTNFPTTYLGTRPCISSRAQSSPALTPPPRSTTRHRIPGSQRRALWRRHRGPVWRRRAPARRRSGVHYAARPAPFRVVQAP